MILITTMKNTYNNINKIMTKRIIKMVEEI